MIPDGFLERWGRLEGRTLEARWRQADMLLELCGQPLASVNDGSRAKLEELAEHTGYSPNTLADWRVTAARFPQDRRRSCREHGVGWSVCVELAKENDDELMGRFFADLEAGDRWTRERLRREIGQPAAKSPPPDTPATTEERAELAAELLADPEIAERIIEKPTAGRSELNKAIGRDRARRREMAERARKVNEAGAMPLPAAYSAIILKMAEFTSSMRALADDLEGLAPYHRELVLREVLALAEQCETWRERLEPGFIPEVIEGDYARA